MTIRREDHGVRRRWIGVVFGFKYSTSPLHGREQIDYPAQSPTILLMDAS
ncbi:hypothetical protein ACLB1O_24345 [Escherichia coli]